MDQKGSEKTDETTSGLKVRSAIIDPGGGFRGAFAAGILDYCLDQGILFDLCIGVSAGAANLTSYLSGQKKRNYRFYSDYTLRKEYLSLKNLLKNGEYVNQDYIYKTISGSGGEDPVDVQAILNSEPKLLVVAADAQSGEAVYFGKEDIDIGEYSIFKASSAIPVLFRPVAVGDRFYFDGSIADPIPLQKALDEGAEKIILILSKPADIPRNAHKDKALAHFIRKYPKVRKRLNTRIDRYNQILEQARKLEKEGKVLILSPRDTFGVDTLSSDRESIKKLYQSGYAQAPAILDFLKKEKDGDRFGNF